MNSTFNRDLVCIIIVMTFFLKLKTIVLSWLVNFFNPVNTHNLSKFIAIKNIWSNIKMDNIQGDYIEFGIFKGKTLFHNIKTTNKFQIKNINFYGLDSFEGFPVENHDFFKNKNFITSYDLVESNFKKFNNVYIIKGFFHETLKKETLININSISFAFVDCDIYESSIDLFKYLNNRIVIGGFIMIDDFTSVDNNNNSIFKSFLENFEHENFIFYASYSNGHIYRKIK